MKIKCLFYKVNYENDKISKFQWHDRIAPKSNKFEIVLTDTGISSKNCVPNWNGTEK